MKRHALMDHVYRLVWSQARNAWAVVAGTVRRHSKSISRRKLAALALALISPMAQALPAGGQVNAGSGTISQAGATTTITQQSQNLAINWQSFGIAANEAVRFNQPDVSSIALNRVLGHDPSRILGSLSANGQIFVLNPNGVLFGSNAQVNVGGLVASTLSMSDADFMAGKHSFSKGGATGNIVNQGALTAANGGYIALLAPEVRNEGVITATLGTTLLAAGDKVTLNLNNGSLISYSIDQGSLNALAENKQLIQADGGQVVMTAMGANQLTAAVVNNTGIIEARTIENHNGVIKLLGDMQAGQVNVDGTLDASAPNSGDGGFIETSAAHVKIADTTHVTTVASAGKTGTWLIDPNDYTIAASGGDITGATLSTNLGTGNVSILSSNGAGGTAGAVNVNDVVAWSANKLTLNAQNNININANLNGSGTASLALEYGQGAVAAGNASDYIVHAAVNLPAGTTNFTTKLGSDGAAKNYTVITSLGAAGSTTATDLQGMKGNLAINYALGANIDATATSTWNSNAGFNPVGNNSATYGGIFAGLGHAISNLVIARSTTDYIGLFGMTASPTVVIRNVGLEGGSMNGRDDVGMLVGYSNSTISNSYATGSVSGRNSVGGLVGLNRRTISASYATGSVSATADWAGGLVGQNNGFSSNINNSYATGSVSSSAAGGVIGIVGGLVGQNNGTISKSYATGSVSSNATAGVGGLVGYNYATVSNSFWDTQTSGKSTSGGGTGMTTANMMTQANFTSATAANGNANPGWDFTNTWWMSDTNTRPFQRMEYNTTINNAHQLQLMSMNLGASYTLANNIAMGELAQASGMWNTTNGFVPVGSSSTPFTGAFDGLNYAISSLLVYLPATNYVGLFGYTSGANISNVSVAGNVTGYDYVGGLVGKTNNSSTISNVTSTVTVTGHAQVGGIVGWNDPSTLNNVAASGNVTGVINVGGIVGWNDASVINGATFSGTVTGSDGVGGLAGNNSGASNINQVFAGGSVSGSANTGSVIGSNDSAATSISNGKWDKDSAGTTNAIGGGSITATAGLTGLTLAETHQQASYAGWDFVNTWRIYEGHTTPLLKSSLTPLTITANNVTKVYDGTSVGLTGVVYSDPAAAGSSKLFGIATPYGVVTKNNAGTYAADIWSDKQGYDITVVGGQLTVSKAPLTVTASNTSKTYDGLAYSGGNGVAYSGLVNGETATALGGALAYGGTSQGAISAGSYAITPSGLTSGNYAISYVDGALTVNKAPLTVTASNASKTYDGLAYSGGKGVAYSGLVNGETATALGGALAYGGTSQGAISAGSYAITPSGLTSGNYAISYVDGALTVNKASLTVTASNASKTYDGLSYSGGNGVAYSGLVNGETATALGGALAYGGTSQGAINAGSYVITPSGLTSGNYAISYVDGALTVNKAPLTVTVNTASKTYDGLSYSGGNGVGYSGFVNNETPSILGGALAYGGNSQGAINVGSYVITPSGLISNNYTFSYINGVLSVNSGSPAQAVATLGGSTLIPAYDAAVVAVTAPVNPVVIALNIPPNLLPAVVSTPANPAANNAATDNGGGVPASPGSQPAATPASSANKAAGDNGREASGQPVNARVEVKSHDTVEQVGGLTIINGGVRLVANKRSPDEGNVKAGSDKGLGGESKSSGPDKKSGEESKRPNSDREGE